jgi:hypothetical protein
MINLFSGVPGAGKTQMICELLMSQKHEMTFLVRDSTGDFSDPHSPRWRNRDPEIRFVKYTQDAIPEELEERKPGIYVFPEPWLGEQIAQIGIALGWCTYVDDEIDLVAVYKGWIDNPLREYCHRARHKKNAQGEFAEIHLFGGMRRIQNVHTDVTSMADQMFVFRSQGKQTMKRLTDEGIILPAHVEQVRTFQGGKDDAGNLLPHMEFLLWKNSGTHSFGRLDNPFYGKHSGDGGYRPRPDVEGNGDESAEFFEDDDSESDDDMSDI